MGSDGQISCLVDETLLFLLTRLQFAIQGSSEHLSAQRRSRVGTGTEPRTKRDKHLYSETSRNSFPVPLTQKNIPHWSAGGKATTTKQVWTQRNDPPPIVSATTTTTSLVSYDRENPSDRLGPHQALCEPGNDPGDFGTERAAPPDFPC